MKKLMFLLLVSFLTVTSALAHPYQRNAHRRPAKAVSIPAQYVQPLNDRALQLTCFFTDVLRLTRKQASEVRRVTLLELVQQNNLVAAGPMPVAKQYELAMMRILTPGQYSAFHWLEERQPVANLLISDVRELVKH
ncbi:hypothetical protein [Hymenobacter seoulensis]